MNILLLGAPGAGKGTQAVRIAKEYSLPHISTGDILRKHLREATEIGQQAKEFISRGELVPDDLVIEIVRQRLCESDCAGGYLLDGFPRTVPQAEALDVITKIDMALNIDINLKKLMARLTGRRVCVNCGESFHVSTHQEESCDNCGGKLYQREDDKPETVSARLEVYQAQTLPLIAYYSGKGLLKNVDGDDTPDNVFAKIREALQ